MDTQKKLDRIRQIIEEIQQLDLQPPSPETVEPHSITNIHHTGPFLRDQIQRRVNKKEAEG